MKIVESLNKLGDIVIPKKWEPIGTIKIFDREQDMSKLYYGTWELTLKERSPIGINPDSTDDRFKTAGNQFGEKKHTLTIDEMPEHKIDIPASYGVIDWGLQQNSSGYSDFLVLAGNNTATNKLGIGTSGRDQPHNNIHPVEVVYFYKRIA